MIDFVNVNRHEDELPLDGVLRVKNKEYWYVYVGSGNVPDDLAPFPAKEERYYIFFADEDQYGSLCDGSLDPFTSLRVAGLCVNLNEVEWFH